MHNARTEGVFPQISPVSRVILPLRKLKALCMSLSIKLTTTSAFTSAEFMFDSRTVHVRRSFQVFHLQTPKITIIDTFESFVSICHVKHTLCHEFLFDG